jgi:hypothetical protein
MQKQRITEVTSPGATSPTEQPQPREGSPTKAADPNPNLHYYKMELTHFMPIKVPAGWNEKQDIDGFIEIWGQGNDYWKATSDLLESDLDKLHCVLEAGISYFARTCDIRPALPPATMSIKEKVALFSQLLPASAEERYVLRFSLSLAKIAWLDCERERIARYPENQRWLYPLYTLADELLEQALLLEDALRCEHHDFDGSSNPEIDR